MTEKTELRHKIALLKKQYTQQQLTDMSEVLIHHIEKLDRFSQANCILLYSSLPDEVQTKKLIDRWWEKKTILLPVVIENDLELRSYRGPQYMIEGAFHISEPTGPAFTDFAHIDLAIIPGVAFDKEGNRLGRGRGYYDRLLSRLSAFSIYKIGLCFPFQKICSIPHEMHDIAMDEIL
jgi:5-formyltetrahydrofolate cyclo-ligase